MDANKWKLTEVLRRVMWRRRKSETTSDHRGVESDPKACVGGGVYDGLVETDDSASLGEN